MSATFDLGVDPNASAARSPLEVTGDGNAQHAVASPVTAPEPPATGVPPSPVRRAP